MTAETIDERIARLEKELADAKRERGLLEVGTEVKINGVIVQVDEDDEILPYKVMFLTGRGNDYEYIWFATTIIAEAKKCFTH